MPHNGISYGAVIIIRVSEWMADPLQLNSLFGLPINLETPNLNIRSMSNKRVSCLDLSISLKTLRFLILEPSGALINTFR